MEHTNTRVLNQVITECTNGSKGNRSKSHKSTIGNTGLNKTQNMASTGNRREQDHRQLRLEQFVADPVESGVALERQLQYVDLRSTH
ncbi:hypothetical protein RYX36_026022 [Vicia faba]